MRLIPREERFFEMFVELAAVTQLASRALLDMLDNMDNLEDRATTIRDLEHRGDNITHEIKTKLNKTFITPFDREDIHELVNGIDDIIDMIDALAKRFPIFHVMTMTQDFRQQTDVLVQATIAMSDAVHRLRKTRKLSELKDTLIEIHRLESVGDDVNHAALSKLYDGQTAALEVMKWKELYDYIENAIDGCEDVGNTLERIVLKNG